MIEADIRDVHIERYYPDVVASAKEFKAMAEAINPELVLDWQAIWSQFINTFVLSADLVGIRRWEDMLFIIPLATDTLEDRRQSILSVINATLPYTERRMHEILDALCGADSYEARLDVLKEELGIFLDTDKTMAFNKVFPMMRAIIPANLDLLIGLMILEALPNIRQDLDIFSKAKIKQKVWGFGTAEGLYWDGKYFFDGKVAHGGYVPISEWEKKAEHKVRFFAKVSVDQSRNPSNLDGEWPLDGRRTLDGWGEPYAVQHSISIIPVENGEQKEAIEA